MNAFATIIIVINALVAIYSWRLQERSHLKGRPSAADVQAAAMQLEQPLLVEVDKGFSDSWWTNYRKLVARREGGDIAPDEMRELMALTDTLEEVNVRRMACFASASKLLGMSLDELMEKAHLKPKLA